MILKIYLKDDFRIGTPYLKPENSPGPLTEYSTGTLVVLLDYLASSLYFTWVNPTNRKFEERALYRAAELDETGRYAYKATIFPIMTVGLARQDSAFSMVCFREGGKLSPYIKIPVVRSIYPEQTEIPPTAVDEINAEINEIKQDIHEIEIEIPNREVLVNLSDDQGKLKYKGQEIKPTPVQVINEESTDEEIPSALAVQKLIGGWVEQDAYPVLPENLVLGNGTETSGNPFPIREGNATSPKIEAVEDPSSPVKDICPFAIKISAPDGDESANMFYAVDFFDFNNSVAPSKISWGFWIKNTDVNNIGLTPMNNIDFWIYNHANYSAFIKMRIYDAVNSTLNTSLDLTISPKTINPTLTGTVKKIEESNGWSYLLYELTMSKESWAFNSSSKVAKFYFRFNPAKTALATKQITIANNTIVYDYTIPSGFVRFPQGAISQHPESTVFHPGLIVKMKPKDFFEMDPESELIATEGAVQQLLHPFYGDASLPINEQKGNGTLTPCLFATKNGDLNVPTVEQELNTSPMSEVLEYQHRLYASVPPSASSFFLHYTKWGSTLNPPLKQLDSTINRLTFGMWIKDDFLAAIPSSNFQVWIYNSSGGNYAKLDFPWKTVYSEVGNEDTRLATLVLGNSAMMTAVPTTSTKCLAKQDGWTYIQHDISGIEWVSTFTNFGDIILYFIFNNIRSGFLTADCRFSNFTFLYNYDGENLNPYAVYPDGMVVDQYPSNVTIPAKVEKNITDIAALKTEIKELKESSPTGKGVVVSISGNKIAFRAREWAEADYDLVHTASIVGGSNGNLFNFGAIGKIPATTPYNQTSYGTLLKSCGDDSCPANFNGTYIGANHAYSIGNSIVATAHGKTEADIGSIWVDTTQPDVEYVLFKIHDIDTLWFAPKTAQMMDTGIFTSKALAAGKILTHKSGATNISDITIETVNSNAQQLYSTTNKVVHKLLLNGTKEVPLTDGFYESNFVDFVEQYNIIYFPTVLTYLINNVGNNTNTSMNNDSIDDYYCSVSITHRFQKNGACVMFESYDINKEINVGYFGMTQSIAFNTANHYMYVPNTIYDDITLHEPSTSIYLTPDKWRNPNLPPTSYFQLYDANATYTMNTGFCPDYGTARPEIRVEQLSDAAFFYSSFKMYQKLISGGKLYPGDRVEAVVYRILSPKYDEDFTNVSWYWVNDDIYLQVNAHKPIKKILPLPSYMIGKMVTIVESNNTTVGNIVTTDGLSINMTGTSNYAILKLSNNKEDSSGTDGADGREIELQTSDTHIQWRYVGDTLWTNLVALADLKGEPGELIGQVQADWAETDSEELSYIKNKPTDIIFEVASLTSLTEEEKTTISAQVAAILNAGGYDIDTSKYDDLILHFVDGYNDIHYHYSSFFVEDGETVSILFESENDNETIKLTVNFVGDDSATTIETLTGFSGDYNDLINKPTPRPTIELEVASLTTLTQAEKLAIRNKLSALIVDNKIDGTKFDDIVLVTTNDLIRLHYSSIDYYVANPQITVIFETQSTKYILNVPVEEYGYSTLTSTSTYTKAEIDAMFASLLEQLQN